jgi:diguanylate cyclase (GGDEF)-like protein
METENSGSLPACGRRGEDMVDREQEQARQLAEDAGPRRRAGRDLGGIVLIMGLLVGVAALTGAGARLADATGSSDKLGDLLAIGLLVTIGAVVFGYRRYRDAVATHRVLEEMATLDALTGLPNRRFLGEPFERMLDRACRTNGRIAVLFVDLLGMKNVNDVYGHEVGDHILSALADRLHQAVGPDDVVVRYGGDEFVVLCPDVTNAVSAERVATRVIQAIETPFSMGSETLEISGCVGVAITEERPARPEEVLADADAAMHQAKAAGPGHHLLFDRSMRDRLTPASAERRLREALELGQFHLYYQPIVSLWTKRLVGAEALLRWHDPNRGVVGPEEFLDALERTDLIVPVGEWVFEEVCRQSSRWQSEHGDQPALNLKVNVTPRQLAHSGFIPHLRQCLTNSRADPDHIYLEVNERGLLETVDAAWATLREAKQLGVSLALDDFGTGYSSLTFLRTLSLDLLSIDRSFITGVGSSREDTTIVEHLIGMAKALGIVTIAEGVETAEQVELLRSINCDLAQGWYFSAPQPPDVITELLAQAGGDDEWHPPAPATDPADAPVVRVDRFEPAVRTA